MTLSHYFEKLFPFYKKYLAKKILSHYETILYHYFEPLIPKNDIQFRKYIFIDKIIANPSILLEVLITFQNDYIKSCSVMTTKEEKKIIKSLTFFIIYKNPQLMFDFIIKVYNTLYDKYNEEDSEKIENIY